MIEFQRELGGGWTFADSAGNVHIVYYSEDLLSPQFFYGWSTLSYFYGFKGDHHILFRYVVQNFFHITVYMGELCESGVNRYLKEVKGREPLTNGPFEHFHSYFPKFIIQSIE